MTSGGDPSRAPAGALTSAFTLSNNQYAVLTDTVFVREMFYFGIAYKVEAAVGLATVLQYCSISLLWTIAITMTAIV